MTTQAKIISTLAILVVGLGVALWAAQPQGSQSNTDTKAWHAMPSDELSKNQLSPDVDTFDFGTISMKNGKVNKTFTVTNSNTESVSIKKLYTSCMCTEAFIVKNNTEVGPYGMPGHGGMKAVNETISPNASMQVKVVFDPNAHGPSGVGVIERDVIAEDATGKVMSFHFKANVIP